MSVDNLPGLLSRVALGDRAAFSALYAATSPKLFGVCLRMLQNRHDAEEALQEVYVKVWQRAGRYAADSGSPMGWLATIARNHAIDLLRSRKAATSDIDEAFDLADDAPTPEAVAVLASEGRRIDGCMQQLEADRARAVRSAYVEGLSYEELAGQFGIPLNTMRTWLRRSLLKLKECMDQ